DAEAAQEQGLLDVVGPTGQVGQGEGRSDGESLVGGLAAHAAQAQAGLGRGALVFEGVAVGEGRGEQLGGVAEGSVEPGPERLGLVDDVTIIVLADGQAEGRTAGGHGPPPSLTGIRTGGSWPFPSARHLLSCSRYTAPQTPE